jgi:hypothetical protein
MGNHAAHRAPRRGFGGAAKFAVPAVTGIVVFGAVSAFAATLSVSSKSLGAGNATVSGCNAGASVTYNTTYSAALPGYKVSTAPVTTAAACTGMAYKVTLTGTGNASLGEISGTLDSSGGASPDFSSSNVAASGVTGVSVVITG